VLQSFKKWNNFLNQEVVSSLLIGSFWLTLGWRIKNRLIALIRGHTVLLVKYTYIEGWYAIGGAIDPGESSSQAIIRELFEEVWVTVTQKPGLIGVYYNYFQGRDDYIIFLRLMIFPLQRFIRWKSQKKMV
jgi:8-oxo-dGTP pyrophosphatase MutT (NUDIX family)